MDELELSVGPPNPDLPPEPGEWMRRFASVPLLYQPGRTWMYNTGAEVLGVLIARRRHGRSRASWPGCGSAAVTTPRRGG